MLDHWKPFSDEAQIDGANFLWKTPWKQKIQVSTIWSARAREGDLAAPQKERCMLICDGVVMQLAS